jgi:hypothetical protein
MNSQRLKHTPPGSLNSRINWRAGVQPPRNVLRVKANRRLRQHFKLSRHGGRNPRMQRFIPVDAIGHFTWKFPSPHRAGPLAGVKLGSIEARDLLVGAPPELKECLFCHETTNFDLKLATKKKGPRILCNSCGATGPHDPEKNIDPEIERNIRQEWIDAAAQWNDRETTA